jgi:hypothetical protein
MPLYTTEDGEVSVEVRVEADTDGRQRAHQRAKMASALRDSLALSSSIRPRHTPSRDWASSDPSPITRPLASTANNERLPTQGNHNDATQRAYTSLSDRSGPSPN